MVSVVIVNWNSGPLLERCVGSLRKNAPDCEIVIVDNHSRDSSMDFVGGLEGGILLVRNRENLGFAAACNQGWRASRGDMILFLNPDAECLSGGVGALAQRLQSEAAAWAAGGCLFDPSGRQQAGFNVRAFPTIRAVAAEALLLDEIWPGNPWTRAYRMTDWDHHARRDVDQPAAACLMVRRSALETLLGFDEKFWPAWFEDVDLCKRIRNHGGRIVFEPEAQFSHYGASSLRRLSQEEFLRYYHTNQIRYFAKHFGHNAAARVRRLVIAGLGLRFMLACLRVPLRGQAAKSAARAFWQAGRHLSSDLETGP